MAELLDAVQQHTPLEVITPLLQRTDINSCIPLLELLMPLLVNDPERDNAHEEYRRQLLHLVLDRGAHTDTFMKYMRNLSDMMDTELLRKLLANGLTVDTQDEEGYTLLMYLYGKYRNIILQNQVENGEEKRQRIEATILALLNHDPPPDVSLKIHKSPYFNGDTILHAIAAGPITPFTFQLFDRLATSDTINLVNDRGETPLYAHVSYRDTMRGIDTIPYEDMLNLFEQKGADFLVRRNNNEGRHGLIQLVEEIQEMPEFVRIVREKVRRAQESAQGVLVQRGRQGQQHRVPPGMARRITNFLGGKRKTHKGKKGKKGRKSRKGRKGKTSKKTHSRR